MRLREWFLRRLAFPRNFGVLREHALAASLILSSDSPDVIAPGDLGSDSVAFGIHPRDAATLPTTFLFPAGSLAPFSGTIEHSGSVFFNGDSVQVGDFTIGFDAALARAEQEGLSHLQFVHCLIADQAAARLLLTSSLVDAEEVRMGVFYETSDETPLWAEAMEIAKECADGAAASATSHTTEAACEGIPAFTDKRRPK